MSDETPKGKDYAKLPWNTFQALWDKLPDTTPGQLAEALGYSGAPVLIKWRAEGQCPKVAVVALEALVRRQNPRNAELHPRIMLVKFRDKDSAALFELMADKVKGMEVLYKSEDNS